ncbi:sensor histidine kinase [Clostridium estertheticum]|uniref:cache domain-containing sensor histidine kinase n=1 Tax=Clostridium estertheticum TaxID=238834 RepID=UPI001C6E414D|nr:sensor histidine kinase [Clostridium estertheticum]MBW9172631.1 sensor histidine kinase [Clostridium estertheticum]WLC73625.1 sensor histidine kinase [Clostridium estertheticum]
MTKIINKLRNNSLFFKLTLIMLISSICISIITALTIMNISKKVFINNFSVTNTKSLNEIKDTSADLNDKLISLMNTINDSWAFRRYLTEYNISTIDLSNIIYNLKQHLKNDTMNLNSKDIDFLLIGANNSTYIRSSALLTIPVNEIKENQITKNSLKSPNKLLYQYSNSGFNSLTTHRNVIIATKVLHDQRTKQQFGMLYISINENTFKKLYSNFTTKSNDVAIMSSDGTIVSSNKENIIGTIDKPLLNIAKNIDNNNLKFKNVKLNNKNYTVLAEYMPIYNFYLVNIIDTNVALKDMYNIKEIVLFCGLIIAISVSILFVITRKTINPLRVLVKEMSKITEGDFNNHINLAGSSEIKKLSSSFNYMLDDLNNYVEKLLIAQKEQRKSELSALQMQINPHFIYNTLASIKLLVLKEDKEKASETINSFISLLQNTISETSETITVDQEIENLKNYVFINETRCGDNIKVNFHVFEQCVNYRLPKLVLQPFIENALFHAFTGNEEGRIHVFISVKNNNLLCEIIDNGIGMEESQLQSLYSSPTSKHIHFTGIGIKNVDNRIKLLYGNDYGVTITSKINVGTTINVYLPLI